MKRKYELVLWPESQQYIGRPDCYYYNGENNGAEDFDPILSQAVFAPVEKGQTFYLALDPSKDNSALDRKGHWGAPWTDGEPLVFIRDTRRPDEIFCEMFLDLREKIFPQIREALSTLNGKVSLKHYHETGAVNRMSFFETDDEPYELFLVSAKATPEAVPLFILTDDSGNARFEKDLGDFSAEEANAILTELLDVQDHINKTGEPVVKE